MCIHPTELCLQLSIQIHPIFYQQSQHGRIKKLSKGKQWCMASHYLCTGNLIILTLGSMLCHAPRAGKYQINNCNWQAVHMSVCRVRWLGWWCLCLSLPPFTQTSVPPTTCRAGARKHWQPCVYSSYISMGNEVYILTYSSSTLLALYFFLD